jgi:8-oxo-dGTP pyrophosphatase MutT (NUDIX family)
MKIPPQAKRVFKGIIYDVYHWQQKMFDGSSETFEMLKRVNTIEVIAVKDGKICISHQSQPTRKDFYSLFGGRAEEGEEPLVTAKRELLEESGMTSNNWELYKTYQPIHKIDWEIYTFIAKDCKKVAKQKLDAGEEIEIMELSFDKFIEFVLSDEYWGNEIVIDILRMKDKGTLMNFKDKLLK